MRVTGMIAQELRWIVLRGTIHPLPEADRIARLVSSARHVHQTDVVGFRFRISAPRERKRRATWSCEHPARED
jgi:hypothetical protein